MQATMIGLDIAKSVFQAHGEGAGGQIVFQKRFARGRVEEFFARLPPALVGIEACGSSHYWARRLTALGHEVQLIPAAYVKPFVKRNKNDARDAAAICAAMSRPDMRFVAIKSEEQQASRGLERLRELLVKQQTQLSNSMRGMLSEFGLVAAQGRRGLAELTALVAERDARIPAALLAGLGEVVAQIENLQQSVAALERQIHDVVRKNAVMGRLCTIPGVGPLTAHAIVAAIGDGRQFDTARDFAAWCGLTPQEHSSANKRRESGISRKGDSRLRKLFTLGASTIMRGARARQERATEWQRGILARRPVKVAVVAQAAKTARIAFAMLRSGEAWRRGDASRSRATAP